ncbi:hypothetical protein D3C75_829490 [compost metagenome]
MRVNCCQHIAGRIDFGLSDSGIAMQRLALQIGQRYGVKIQQCQLADTRSGKIRRAGTTEAAKPDNQYSRGFQRFLAVKIKAAQNNLAVVAQHLLIAQFSAHR